MCECLSISLCRRQVYEIEELTEEDGLRLLKAERELPAKAAAALHTFITAKIADQVFPHTTVVL